MKKSLWALLAFSLSVYSFSAMAKTGADPFGGSSKFKSKQPVEITSDSLEVQQEQHTATFTGHVIAVQGDVHLKSEIMIVHYHAPADGDGTKKAPKKEGEQNSIEKIDVRGGVFLSTPEETASGDNGVYDVENKKITLNTNVILTRDKNTLKGDRLVYDFATGKSVLSSGGVAQDGKPRGRVKALFIPNDNESLAPKK